MDVFLIQIVSHLLHLCLLCLVEITTSPMSFLIYNITSIVYEQLNCICGSPSLILLAHGNLFIFNVYWNQH